MESSNPSIPGTINPPPGLPPAGGAPPPPLPPNVGSLLGSKENSPSFDSALGRTVALLAPLTVRFRCVVVNVVVVVVVVVVNFVVVIMLPSIYPDLKCPFRTHALSSPGVRCASLRQRWFSLRLTSRASEPRRRRRRRRRVPSSSSSSSSSSSKDQNDEEGLKRSRQPHLTISRYCLHIQTNIRPFHPWGSHFHESATCPNFLYRYMDVLYL